MIYAAGNCLTWRVIWNCKRKCTQLNMCLDCVRRCKLYFFCNCALYRMLLLISWLSEVHTICKLKHHKNKKHYLNKKNINIKNEVCFKSIFLVFSNNKYKTALNITPLNNIYLFSIFN